MKSLIRPMIVVSFILTATSAVPGIPILCGLLGFLSLAATYATGLMLLGAEDKDWQRQLSLMEIERQKIVSDFEAKTKEVDALKTEVSAGLAKLRDERRQDRPF